MGHENEAGKKPWIDSDQRVMFNLGSKQLEIIGELLSQASIHCRNNSRIEYYNTLHALKLQIIARLSKEERKQLLQYETLIRKYLTVKMVEGNASNSNYVAFQNKALGLIFQYDTLLKELLETKGFLIPLREGATSLFDRTYEG